MSLNKEQLRPNGGHEINPGKTRKWFKNQYNRALRREAKDINNEHPKTNYYRGWAN